VFIKLSYPLSEKTPVCFGYTVKTKFIPVKRIANGNHANTTEVHLFTHNGTHMDAPWHFNPEGKHVDELDVEDWVFNNPKAIDVSHRPKRNIGRSDIEPFFSKDDNSDLLLVFSGLSLLIESNTKEYMENFPGFTSDAADFILKETKIRAIALDLPSVDPVENILARNYPIHRMMLGDVKHSLIIIENVNIAPALGKKVNRVFAVPLLLEGLDGSPINIFAEVD